MGKTFEVKVKAPQRQGFNGYWSAQRHFPAGENTTVTVDERELRELLADDKAGFLMVEDSEGLRAQLPDQPSANSSGPTGLAPDEEAVLAQYRLSKAATSNQAEVQAKARQDAADAKAQAQDAGRGSRK